MDRRRWMLSISALVMSLAASSSARAGGMITYTFSGTVSNIANPTGLIDSSIQVGSPFTLTASIPSDTPNTLGSSPTFGHYEFPTNEPGAGMSLAINGRNYPLGPAGNGEIARIDNAPYADTFSGYQIFNPTSPSGLNSVRLDFDLLAASNINKGDALPLSLNLADYPVNPSISISYFYNDNRAYPSILGTIDSVGVSAQQVPEPSSILCFSAIAAAVLGWRRR